MSQEPFDLGKVGYAGAMAAASGWQNLLGAGKTYPHAEVEAAFEDYAARANMNDWEHWCDIFTDKCLYVDHHFGVFHSRDEVAKWMVPLMSRQPEMRFIPGWHVIQGNLVIKVPIPLCDSQYLRGQWQVLLRRGSLQCAGLRRDSRQMAQRHGSG